MPIIVGGVLEKDGKYLLVQEAQEKCYGKWNLPAGHLDPNETIIEAAKREIKEETNLNIDVIKKLGTSRNNKYKLHWFVCTPTDVSLLKIVEPFKQKELKWVDINDSTINWTPKNSEALMKYKNQISNIQKEIRS